MANPCLKVSFSFVNILYTLTAIGLAAGAIWYSLKVKEVTDLRSYEKYQLDLNIYWPQVLPYIFVAIAVFVVLVTCCGLCGAGTGSKGGLITYNVFLFIVILILIGAGVTSVLVATQKCETFIKDTLHDVFQEAQRKNYVREEFGNFERNLHCCGADGPNNYLGRIPESCCNEGDNCNEMVNRRKGCIEVATVYTKWAFIIGTAACGVVAFLCIISMALSYALIRSIGSKTIN
ncbi:23 kDa integral membrane protein-like [Pectinophora gossypiella]|uniref:23 kDa integral membrane protein-like n=1 Tax=Pectinophora gossypiella TaxID=13191 RepID=UPI00214EC386|nr:23 kDa integral membrane protein-like [Pectinophora gossypiella]